MVCPIQGMEDVVATVSGYHGAERFNLIKLISHAGASYVGAMSRSVTHLVCWKFEGKKYSFAKKFKTIIVNHRWVEECIKQCKRVPECPYMLQGGQEIGPLMMEALFVAKKGVLTRKHKIFSEQSNVYDDSEKETRDMGWKHSDLAVWTDSFLLNENLFPEYGKSGGRSRKLKPKPVGNTPKQENQSSSRYCFQKPTFSGLVRTEHEEARTSMHPVREKRKVINGSQSTSSSEPSSKGRRLVKKNACRDIVDFVLSDSDQECHPNSSSRAHNRQNNVAEHSDGERDVRNAEFGGTSVDEFYRHADATNGAFEDVEEIEDWNYPLALKGSKLRAGTSHAVERTSQDGGSDVDNLDEKIKDMAPIENVTRLPPSEDSLCVICLTKFSSTIGILPCGHRFCYSCIQNWADHMASRRKILTCPYCKASFVSIIKLEDVATSDQKIYSQTIPCASSTRDIFILTDQERLSGAQSLASVCSKCCYREPEDLLISCHLCQIRCIHSYCLDPYLLPWTCSHCKDLQMLYHHAC